MDKGEFLGVVAIVGDEGCGKSTMLLSFPRPIFHFDVDVGGFRRAIWRIAKEEPDLRIKRCAVDEALDSFDFSDYDIITKSYPKPLQTDKLMGQLTGEGSTPSVRKIQVPKKVEGMKELWQTFVTDFVYVCSQPVATMGVDSSTTLWGIAHNTRLQELQEIQVYKWQSDPKTKNTPFPENEYRERLQPIEYGVPNDRMRTVFHTARSFETNLVLTHYPTDEYGMVPSGKSDGSLVEGKTGKKVMDGFKETAKLADLIVWVDVRETSRVVNGKTVKTPAPTARITKCGLEGMGLDAVGMEIPATFSGIINLRNLMKGGS